MFLKVHYELRKEGLLQSCGSLQRIWMTGQGRGALRGRFRLAIKRNPLLWAWWGPSTGHPGKLRRPRTWENVRGKAGGGSWKVSLSMAGAWNWSLQPKPVCDPVTVKQSYSCGKGILSGLLPCTSTQQRWDKTVTLESLSVLPVFYRSFQTFKLPVQNFRISTSFVVINL